jgi:hypothetical protein
MKLLDRIITENRSLSLELARHFFGGLLQPESAIEGDCFREWIVQALGLLAAASWILPIQLFRRYVDLHALPSPRPYFAAYSSDVLWTFTFIALFMALVTIVEWPALFVSERDHLILGALPLSQLQVFGAKIFALGLFLGLFAVATTLLPSLAFPIIGSGRWEPRPISMRVVAFLISGLGAGFFISFSLIAAQGLLLLTLPLRWFRAVAFAMQVALLLVILCAFPVLPYLPAHHLAATRSQWLDILPSGWFWAIHEHVLGSNEPRITELARIGTTAFAIASMIAGIAYLGSYLRYGRHAGEVRKAAHPRRFLPLSVRAVFRTQRSQAVGEFVAATLARGRQQKLILFLIGGLGFAVIVENSVYLALHSAGQLSRRSEVLEKAAVAFPLTLSFFGMVGLRRVFRIPADLPANWIFRFLEDPGATEEQREAVFLTFTLIGAILPVMLCLPLQFAFFGAKALFAMIAQCLLAFVFAEYLMSSWSAIPFTAEFLNQRHLVQSIVAHIGEFVLYSVVAASWIQAGLHHARGLAALFVFLLAAYIGFHHRRRHNTSSEPLHFEESAPVLEEFRLLRD